MTEYLINHWEVALRTLEDTQRHLGYPRLAGATRDASAIWLSGLRWMTER